MFPCTLTLKVAYEFACTLLTSDSEDHVHVISQLQARTS